MTNFDFWEESSSDSDFSDAKYLKRMRNFSLKLKENMNINSTIDIPQSSNMNNKEIKINEEVGPIYNSPTLSFNNKTNDIENNFYGQNEKERELYNNIKDPHNQIRPIKKRIIVDPTKTQNTSQDNIIRKMNRIKENENNENKIRLNLLKLLEENKIKKK